MARKKKPQTPYQDLLRKEGKTPTDRAILRAIVALADTEFYRGKDKDLIFLELVSLLELDVVVALGGGTPIAGEGPDNLLGKAISQLAHDEPWTDMTPEEIRMRLGDNRYGPPEWNPRVN